MIGRASRAGFTALTVAFAAACGGSATTALPIQTRPSPKATLQGGAPAHIAVVVLENHEYGQVIGNRSEPYLNGLAKQYALATRSYAIGHPSLPNYLALTGGSTFGYDSDCTDCSVPGSGLAGQLDAKRISWKGYMESLPHPCFTGSGAGEYAKKHDPFVYYRALVKNKADCDRVVPLTELTTDERAHDLPQFIWITPNLCHDAHDCPISTADRFLKGLLPPLLARLGANGLLFLTFDEGRSDNACCRLAGGGQVVTIAAGQGARRHARLSIPVDHYSLLQTIEDVFGLSRLRGAGCACTPSLGPMLKGG